MEFNGETLKIGQLGGKGQVGRIRNNLMEDISFGISLKFLKNVD